MNLSNTITFISTGTSVQVHHHYCYQITITLDHHFDCLLADGQCVNLQGIIVNQNVPNSCSAPQSTLLVIFVDANSALGWQLKDLLQDRPYLDLATLFTSAQLATVLPPDYTSRTVAELQPYVRQFLQKICPADALRGQSPASDARVYEIIHYVRQHLSNRLTVEDAATLIHLSPERTRHLFTQQMGIPFTQYVLWARIRQILLASTRDHLPLAMACLAHGFSDAVYFARIFKRIFGMTPNQLIKNCRFLHE